MPRHILDINDELEDLGAVQEQLDLVLAVSEHWLDAEDTEIMSTGFKLF